MILFLIPIVTTLLLSYKFKEINLITLLLISIGITQGLTSNLAFTMGYDKFNWGVIKGFLLIGLFLFTVLRFKNLNVKLPLSFLIWSTTFLIFVCVIFAHIVEAANNGQSLNVFNTFQNFALVNMLLVFVAFFGHEKKQSDSIINLLIFLAKPISIIAILQWGLLKFYEIDVSLFMAEKSFGSLNADDDSSLRVFSVFYNHYGLSAFLTLTTVIYVARSLYKPKEFNLVWFFLFFFAHSLTYNLTGLLLTIAGCIFATLLYKLSSKINFSKPIFFRIIGFSIIGLSIAVFNPTFQKRISGIYSYSVTSSGAGNSLYQRNIFIGNGLDILATNPSGLGLSLTDTSKDVYENLGFVRDGLIDNGISADSWFLWLSIQVGIFFMGILLLLYLIPFILGVSICMTSKSSSQWQICAYSSLLFISILGGISNSPILNYPPSNILLWLMVGTLFADFNKNRVRFKNP